jgi:hypothetical protein
VGGGGQQKQPTREGSPDDNDGTAIVGSNGFARRLNQQSTNKGGTRGEMVMTAPGDDD